MSFLKIVRIIGILFSIFVFICKRDKINNSFIIPFKEFLAQTDLARFYTTTQILVSPMTTVFFSGVKIPKEVCVHHIEHGPVLLTADVFKLLLIKFINSYICKGVVSIFVAQLWVCIRLNSDSIKKILIPPL